MVFEQIRRAKPTVLFLVMDGPRPGSAEGDELVRQTRSVCADVDWDCQVHEVFAETNMGLKARVSSGLNDVFSVVDRAIILEDDCLPSQDFFRFATELLETYQDSPDVGLISGASRIKGRIASEYSYSLSRDVRIWGWATWARTWKTFQASGDLDRVWSAEDISTIPELFPTSSRKRHIRGSLRAGATLDSWALPFAVHCVSRGYRNPVPHVNLVRNVGFGASSTHTRFESFVKDVPVASIDFPLRHPPVIDTGDAFDRAEARSDAAALVTYPLRHPIDTARRLLRYAALRGRGPEV